MGRGLPVSALAQIKNKLDRAGVELVAFGVVGIPSQEAEARKVFDFAKVMGIEVIVSEPPREAFTGPVSVEYEHNWDNSVPEIKECAAYFKRTARKLLKK
jgi:sugar phosphate isomerase/epimerase